MANNLLNPFERNTDKNLLLGALAAIVVGLAFGYYFNARFDGVIDVHFNGKTTLLTVATDLLIGIASSGLLLFSLGKYVNSKTRFIDIFTACCLMKIPFFLLVSFNFQNWIYNASTELLAGMSGDVMTAPKISVLLPVLGFALAGLFALIWSVALLYNGYKVATNAKGTQNMLLFATAVLLAETLSKIVLSQLN